MVGHRARKFEPQAAMQMMADLGIRNVFLPPTALKLMRQAGVKNPGVKLRSIFTGGESLGGELLGWVRETFGIDAHEVFGQTECNLVIGSNSNLFPIRPGSMGKATPGFDVRIVNEQGRGTAARPARHHRRAPAVPVHHDRILAATRKRRRRNMPANSC